MIDWEGYTPFYSGLTVSLSELPRPEAREAFDRLMGSKEERIEELRRLLLTNGVRLRDTRDDLRSFERLLFDAVKEENDSSGLSGLWLGVALDAGLFLGDVSIQRNPHLSWRMFDASKDDIAYQRPVVMGFRNVNNKRYCVDFPRGVALELEGHLTGRISSEPDFFVQWLVQVDGDA